MIINEILKTIQENEITDAESEARQILYEITYRFTESKILVHRVTENYSPEYNGSHDIIDMTYNYERFMEFDADLKEYTNLIIMYINFKEHYTYKYGKHATNSVMFPYIFNEKGGMK